MALHRLKTLTVGVVATLILSWVGPVPASDRDGPALPTRAEPLRVDSINKRVLIYTEVNPKSFHQSNPHWGVVFQGGKLKDKAILQAFCTPQEFHDALLQIDVRPGNNLTLRSSGEIIGGDELLVSVIGPGTPRALGLADVLEDSSGKGFRIRFGGNRQRAVEEQTGCITCLESCPIGITSNAAYPAISSFKRMVSPNSQFKGKAETLPRQGGLILIYSSEKNPKMKGEPHGIRSTKQDYGQGQIHQKGRRHGPGEIQGHQILGNGVGPNHRIC